MKNYTYGRIEDIYLPKEYKVLEHSGRHVNTVQKSVAQKQHKVFVICEIYTIVNL